MAEATNPLDPDESYEVPEYLMGMFTIWSLIGPAGLKVLSAHDHAEVAAIGGTDDAGYEWPSDSVLSAWLDSGVELPDHWDEMDGSHLVPVDNEGHTITNHDMMVVAINALAGLSHSLKGRLRDLDGLPDWLQ